MFVITKRGESNMRYREGVSIVVVVFLALLLWAAAYVIYVTPSTWRTCSNGFRPICLQDVKDRKEIITRQDGCITDGTNVICGSYWQKKDKW